MQPPATSIAKIRNPAKFPASLPPRPVAERQLDGSCRNSHSASAALYRIANARGGAPLLGAVVRAHPPDGGAHDRPLRPANVPGHRASPTLADVTMAMTDHIIVEKSGGVLTLTLNRPEKKNALTAQMYGVLGSAIDAAADDPDVRCILLQSNGDSFTAGNDLSEFAAINSGDRERASGNALVSALARATTPIVAAVHGRAVGVGTTMLLHCDLVFITEEAVLTTPFVNLALVPEAASSVLLPARIGHPRAFAMFVLGEPVDGRTAAAWGIANAVVPATELRARARAAAEAIAARPPVAVAITKRLMRDGDALAARIAEENRHFTAQLKSPEAREAFSAFREKRAPDYSQLR